ncbi:MAG: response regulator [Nostoc sp.]|uniref:response regulator n=1 Tax=Nostoc sp. TaxID=1180 RepID=UPI002FF6642E
MIENEPEMTVVGQAGNGQEAIDQYRQLKPNVTLMDLRMPHMNGVGATVAICTEFVDARIIVLNNPELSDCELAQRARAFAPDGFDTALVLVGGDDVQSTLSLVRQGGIITFPNGVMPEPKAPDGVELKKANGFADPMLFDQLNRLVSIGEFQVPIAQTFLLEEAAQAQSAMKKHYLGKIVLRVSGE